jgi:hypothetical protein
MAESTSVGLLKLAKAADGNTFVGEHIENRVQLCDLEKIANFLSQVQQFQIAALILHRCKSTDQFADSRTVNVIDVSEIEENPLSLVIQEPADCLSKQRAAVTKNNTPAQIDNGDLPGVAMRGT